MARDITTMPAHIRARAGIGRTFQIPRPFYGLTVFENVLVGATFAGGRDRPAVERCCAALELAGLLDRANALAGSLSFLDRKRLELARALATRPRAPAARRDRRRPDRTGSPGPPPDDPPAARRGPGDRLDRAHRAGPPVDGRPAHRHERRPRCCRGRAARRHRRSARCDPSTSGEGTPVSLLEVERVNSFYGDLPGPVRGVGLRSTRARPSRSSARTGPASRPCSSSSPASCRPVAARCVSRAARSTASRPTRRVAARHLPGARGPADLSQPDRAREPAPRRVPAALRAVVHGRRSWRCSRSCADRLRPERRRALRRRAAGALDRPGADGESAPDPPRRGVARPRAGRHRASSTRRSPRSPLPARPSSSSSRTSTRRWRPRPASTACSRAAIALTGRPAELERRAIDDRLLRDLRAARGVAQRSRPGSASRGSVRAARRPGSRWSSGSCGSSTWPTATSRCWPRTWRWSWSRPRGVNPFLAIVPWSCRSWRSAATSSSGWSSTHRSTADRCRRSWSPSGWRSSSRTRCCDVFTADSRGLDAGAIENASFTFTDELAVGGLPLADVRGGRRGPRRPGPPARPDAAGPRAAGDLGRPRGRAPRRDRQPASLRGGHGHRAGDGRRSPACSSGIRTTFGPSDGPVRLIFAFETVIIGGPRLAVGHARRRDHPRRGPGAGQPGEPGVPAPRRAPGLPASSSSSGPRDCSRGPRRASRDGSEPRGPALPRRPRDEREPGGRRLRARPVRWCW